MFLEIENIFSINLTPTDGFPEDLLNFNLLVSVYLKEKHKKSSELFYLTVCSRNHIESYESGSFILNTLILNKFDWETITSKINKLLNHVQCAKTWNDVIYKLAGFLDYADKED